VKRRLNLRSVPTRILRLLERLDTAILTLFDEVDSYLARIGARPLDRSSTGELLEHMNDIRLELVLRQEGPSARTLEELADEHGGHLCAAVRGVQ
jgi:hypothetical protein